MDDSLIDLVAPRHIARACRSLYKRWKEERKKRLEAERVARHNWTLFLMAESEASALRSMNLMLQARFRAEKDQQ